MNIEVTVRVWHDRETGEYVAHAVPIDVTSFGRTPSEAKQMVHEAVQAFVESAGQMGTLETVMIECGYQKQNSDWIKPEVVEEEFSVAVGA